MIRLSTIIPLLLMFALNGIAQDSSVYRQLQNQLLGTWEQHLSRGTLTEIWQLDQNTLRGASFFIRAIGDSLPQEQLQLLETPNGQIIYRTWVQRQNNGAAIDFRLTYWKQDTAIFENPTHDFPKRIGYAFLPEQRIEAWIDDGLSPAKKTQRFHFTKQPLPLQN
ncbi:MAG: hypothetical protein RLY16_2981 [Bacteroidota bacterium]